MPSTLYETDFEPLQPAEIQIAQETSRKLASLLQSEHELRLQVKRGQDFEELILPEHAAIMLLEMLLEIGLGNDVKITTRRPTFKKSMSNERLESLNELTRLSQELGLYDDEPRQ
jgi:hypothetical protein